MTAWPTYALPAAAMSCAPTAPEIVTAVLVYLTMP
jgi:hypothetical protein